MYDPPKKRKIKKRVHNSQDEMIKCIDEEEEEKSLMAGDDDEQRASQVGLEDQRVKGRGDDQSTCYPEEHSIMHDASFLNMEGDGTSLHNVDGSADKGEAITFMNKEDLFPVSNRQ